MINLHELVAAHGGTVAVARAVSQAASATCTTGDVNYWLRQGSVPAHWLRPLIKVIDDAGLVDLGRDEALALLRPAHAKRENNSRKKAAAQAVKTATKNRASATCGLRA
jgi:hypothetical protein